MLYFTSHSRDFPRFCRSVLTGPVFKSDFVLLSSAKDSWTSRGCVLRARDGTSANVSVKHQTLDFVCKRELCADQEPGRAARRQTRSVHQSWLTGFWMSAASLRWLSVWQGDETCIALGMFRQAWDAVCTHFDLLSFTRVLFLLSDANRCEAFFCLRTGSFLW